MSLPVVGRCRLLSARLAIAGLAGAAALATAGCAAQPQAALPRKSAALAVPAALASPSLTARQRVVAAYDGYWQAYADAMEAWRIQTAACKRGHDRACNAPTPDPADYY